MKIQNKQNKSAVIIKFSKNPKIFRQIACEHFGQIRLDVEHELSSDSPEICIGKLKMDWSDWSRHQSKRRKNGSDNLNTYVSTISNFKTS